MNKSHINGIEFQVIIIIRGIETAKCWLKKRKSEQEVGEAKWSSYQIFHIALFKTCKWIFLLLKSKMFHLRC